MTLGNLGCLAPILPHVNISAEAVLGSAGGNNRSNLSERRTGTNPRFSPPWRRGSGKGRVGIYLLRVYFLGIEKLKYCGVSICNRFEQVFVKPAVLSVWVLLNAGAAVLWEYSPSATHAKSTNICPIRVHVGHQMIYSITLLVTCVRSWFGASFPARRPFLSFLSGRDNPFPFSFRG
jgi:hypothetical protein